MRDEYDFTKAQRGPVIPSPGKTRITIMLDDDLIEYFRAQAERGGTGYQTRINALLRRAVAAESADSEDERPVTEAMLRRVLREELRPSTPA